jgi:D-threonate/D-erythronate kinase
LLADDVERRLRDGADVVVSIGSSDAPDDPRLAARLGELLTGCAGLAGGVILTGGDTAKSVLRGWNVNSLRLTGEVEAGVPIAVAESPHPTIVVTKAGTFGRPDTLRLARDRVRRALTPLRREQGAR